MSFENPQNIITSWNLQSNFATGPVTVDKLVPPRFTRIRTNFVQTWREEALTSQLDWGKTVNIYLPESLRVVSSIFLRVPLPVLGSASYKAYPGLYIIKEIRLLSAGQEVYTCRYADFLADYCASLNNQTLKNFAKTYLGTDTASLDARVVMLPILLPNSAYLNRNGHDTRGHGAFPAYTGQNRLEIQITFNSAKHVATDASVVPTSISNLCKFMYHQVEMQPENIMKYADSRGSYSIITRRFTQLCDFQHYTASQASAQTKVKWTLSQPQGVVTEVMLIAVAHNADDDRRSATAYVQPVNFSVSADNIKQRDLDTKEKIECENWVNGFNPPDDFPNAGRICFASHASDDNTHMYSGGYNMTLASNIVFEFAFDTEVDYRLVAVQLQRVRLDSLGIMRAYLE